MNTDDTAALVEAFRGLNAKQIAARTDTSYRTTEKWLSGANAPTWRHMRAMLNDDELAPRLLAAAGRSDLAQSAETIARLKAVIASDGGLRELHAEMEEKSARRRETLNEINQGLSDARSSAGRSRMALSDRAGTVRTSGGGDGGGGGGIQASRRHAHSSAARPGKGSA